MNPPAYHWPALWGVLLCATAVACVPLALWRKRVRSWPVLRQKQALTLLTLFLTFDLIIFGAFTRLSDSGLGCPDWPGCYGSISPVGAQNHIEAAQNALPDGPVTHTKAWIEMVHRYFAAAVGFLILIQALWSGVRRPTSPRSQGSAPSDIHPAWAWATLLWVLVQGMFGALTVTMKLFPVVVTLHLCLGLSLLCLLGIQWLRRAQLLGDVPPVTVLPGLKYALLGCWVLLMLQIASGAWVSANYAVLACDTFPLCQGQWWPEMNFAQGFELWRELGHQANQELLSFSALTAIHYTHRLLAYGVVVALLVLLWRLRSLSMLSVSNVKHWWYGMVGVLMLQVLTGLSNVILGWPLVAALLHTAGAAALLLLLSVAVLGVQAGD